MEQLEFRKYSALGQVGAWLLLYAIMFLDSVQYDSLTHSFLYATNFIFWQMALVYLHYRFVLPIFHRGHRLVYFVVTIPLIFVFSSFTFLTDALLPYDYQEDIEVEAFWEMFAYTFPIAALLVAGSSLYYFVEAWYKNMKRESLLKSEKLEAELNFLKSQINPHFLFNTLNNIYSYVQTGNEKSAPMLEKLSSVLRYMVYDCIEDKVSLQQEIQAIEDLLAIYQMKNSEQENIQVEVEGVKRYHLIAPLILVNLVENACKHSDAVSNRKGFIKVSILVDEQNGCQCEMSNSIKARTEANSKYGGVGLENVQQRLDLQYPNNYTLETEIKDNTYYLRVSMPLERKS